MNLYELHRGEIFTLNGIPSQPPDVWEKPPVNQTYKLHNIDGMYSYCEDDKGSLYHLSAFADVEIVLDKNKKA